MIGGSAALAEIAGDVGGCVVAAWVDARTGSVLEHCPAQSGYTAEFVTAVLDAAAEVMRTRERPPRAVLLSPAHVHIVHRLGARVLVVICERSTNLGLAVASVRAFADSFTEAA